MGRKRDRQYERCHYVFTLYKCHVNEGEDVFVALDGSVEMLFKENGIEQSSILETGDIFYASIGIEHVAYLHEEARVLVVESENSV